MSRTGISHLPLHGGHAPPWLFQRMVRLARQITLAVVEEFGPHTMLERLSHPYWFQAFGCLLGFDWHSSGVTTTVCGALKEGLRGLERDTGLFVAGGKGKTSRKTPAEVAAFGDRFGVDADRLVYVSRMTAKVDNSALQDGYQIYHHTLFFTQDGAWAVVQQGMNPGSGWARRYHWHSAAVTDLVCEPHAAVCSDRTSAVLNMVAAESGPARAASAALAREHPERVLRALGNVERLDLPARHHVTPADLRPESLRRVLVTAHQAQPRDFEALLATPGIGPQAVRALALAAEVIYGARPSTRDPVRYSFAHGGKDGHPYPVDRRTYDHTVQALETAVRRARLGDRERMDALRRLAGFLESPGRPSGAAV